MPVKVEVYQCYCCKVIHYQEETARYCEEDCLSFQAFNNTCNEDDCLDFENCYLIKGRKIEENV